MAKTRSETEQQAEGSDIAQATGDGASASVTNFELPDRPGCLASLGPMKIAILLSTILAFGLISVIMGPSGAPAHPTPATFPATPTWTRTPFPLSTPTLPVATATATSVAKPTSTLRPTPTPLTTILEDFEEAKRLNWWTPSYHAFEYRESDYRVHNGVRSLQIDYAKTEAYQFIAAEIPTGLRDFRGARKLQLWVYGRTTLLIKFQDESLREAEICKKSTTNPGGWNLLSCDYTEARARIDIGHIKNILFFPAPGDSAAQGTFYFDDLILR